MPSWPGLGCRVNVMMTMAVRMQPAKIGVKASAKPRGAVQFTDPFNAHWGAGERMVENVR